MTTQASANMQTSDRLLTASEHLTTLAITVRSRFLRQTGIKIAEASRLLAEAAGEIAQSCSKYEQAAMDPKHDFYYPPEPA